MKWNDLIVYSKRNVYLDARLWNRGRWQMEWVKEMLRCDWDRIWVTHKCGQFEFLAMKCVAEKENTYRRDEAIGTYELYCSWCYYMKQTKILLVGSGGVAMNGISRIDDDYYRKRKELKRFIDRDFMHINKFTPIIVYTVYDIWSDILPQRYWHNIFECVSFKCLSYNKPMPLICQRKSYGRMGMHYLPKIMHW